MVTSYYPDRQVSAEKIDGETWRERGEGSESESVGGMFGTVYLNSRAVS